VLGDTLVYADSGGVYGVDASASDPEAVLLADQSLGYVLQSDSDQSFFQTSDGALYAYDGSRQGTELLLENTAKFKVVAENAIYAIQEVGGRTSLWYSDGTTDGTRFIENVSHAAGYCDLENAVAIHTPGIPLPPDIIAPELRQARINGDTLTLFYFDASQLDNQNLPDTDSFSLTGTNATVTGVSVDAAAGTVNLTLSQTVRSTDSIAITYTDPSEDDDAAAIQDAVGNDALSITDHWVRNVTPDNVGPVFDSAVVSGDILTISWSDASDLDDQNLPDTNSISLTGTKATITDLSVDAASKTMTLTLSERVAASDIITFSYTDPSEDNDASVLQDIAGNDAASVEKMAVTNQTEEQAPWSLLLPTRQGFFGSDGTAEGTDLLLSNHSFYNRILTTSKNGEHAVIFVNNELQEVYGVSDLESDPVLLANSFSGGHSTSESMIQFGDKIIMPAHDLITDGTVEGTTIVPGLSYDIADTARNQLWSFKQTGPYGKELFITRIAGNDVSTQLVKDIRPGSESAFHYYTDGVLLNNGNLVFDADDGVHGRETWVSDGTEDGTFMLGDLQRGNYGSSPGQFTAFDELVAFSAHGCDWNTGSEILHIGTELFFTDGTREGTYGLDINPGYASSDPIVLGQGGDLLYFTATVGDSNNTDTRSIFSTDGTTFTCLADILGSAELLDWTESTAYFQVTDAEHGDELWAANLATGDFGLVKDILPGSGAALAGNQDHFLLGDKLAFTAYTSSTTTGLFITDGTEAGTIQLGSAAPIDRVVLGDTLVYANSGGVYGVDASASDPEAVLLADQALEDVLQSDSDQTVFQTSDGKLYTTDGSSQGTELLLDNVDQFKMVAEDAIYAITCANGNNFLWYSDGTPGGTRFVDELVDDYDYYMDDAVAIKTIGIWDEGVIV
jgi:uncharacterized repeat protein (TIGR02059 family)